MAGQQARVQFQRIFHPSDFSEASNVAFAHALKIAVANKARLTMLHTGESLKDVTWEEFPGVRRTLERWKLLPPCSPREAVTGLGLDIEKIVLHRADPAQSILQYLGRHPHDLIVLATHQHDGLARWTHAAVAEPVARRSAEMTLFVPHGIEGIVSANGANRLSHILVAADRIPDPQFSVDAAIALAEAFGCQGATATLMHVGGESDLPDIVFHHSEALQWRVIYRSGLVEQQILKTAAECHAGLIVMSTKGHHGFLDALRGSTTERIVRNARCPVLAAPAYEPVQPTASTIESLATGKLAVGLVL